MLERVISVAIGYLFGLFQTGFLYGKLNGIDIREHGSGNAGSTNALRTLGKKAGIITFIGDSFKCIFAILLVHIIYGDRPDEVFLYGLYAGVGTVLGHAYPCYLGFKGGKGIATSVGLLIAINFWIALIATSCFYVFMKVTKYVSVGSMVLMFVFAAGIVGYGAMGGIHLGTTEMLLEVNVIVIALFLFTVFKHKDNIVRLMNGTENKIGSSQK